MATLDFLNQKKNNQTDVDLSNSRLTCDYLLTYQIG